MQRAKLFMNGRSQAIRLPANFRFNCNEVYIRKDVKTDEVIISPRPNSWESFFKFIESIDIPEDFMNDRDSKVITEKDLF